MSSVLVTKTLNSDISELHSIAAGYRDSFFINFVILIIASTQLFFQELLDVSSNCYAKIGLSVRYEYLFLENDIRQKQKTHKI